MTIDEFFIYRHELLEQSKDEDGFIQESLVLSQVLPLMLDAKLIDSEDYNSAYAISSSDNYKINAYNVNESGERLILFIVDENSIDLTNKPADLQVSQKANYDRQFKRATSFINKAIKGHLHDEIQDADPIRPLISKVSSSEGANQFDVIEIFLISATATTEMRGALPQPKRIDFEEEKIKISFTKNNSKQTKEIAVFKKLIDLNFLYSVITSQGNRGALVIDFENDFNYKIEVIKAAEEEFFESYLCVLPAKLLADLYKTHSSRLLEKNVRSFLQFKGTNKGIRETIRLNPEKFIAFNNGITITSTAKELELINGKTYINKLTDFQIVNGGQTTASIYFTHKDGFSIEKVKVMAKINVAINSTEEGLEELISDISKYSNSQTRVSPVDLGSRNPQLNKIKALSDSVMTPSGRKWFFEKSRGEFNTKLRIYGSNKSRLEKEFPKNYRFSKEQLGKYYTAWGDQPHVVKKGGEKVFRYFLEEISGQGKSKKTPEMDRDFYESLIAKIILFTEMERIYGQGKKSMGQIRATVVPYSISIMYNFTDGSENDKLFDLSKLWKNEKLNDDLAQFVTNLMSLMNELVKKYSESDDYNEYSKNKKLWDCISECKEIENFMSKAENKKLIESYSISKSEKEKLAKGNSKYEVNFREIEQNIEIHSRGVDFYKGIRKLIKSNISKAQENKIDLMLSSITKHLDLEDTIVEFNEHFLSGIRKSSPEIFDKINLDQNYLLENTLKFIIHNYNQSIEKKINVAELFQSISNKASTKKYSSVYSKIGSNLAKGIAPSVLDVVHASNYFIDDSESIKKNTKKETLIGNISLANLRTMVEWDSKMKILTPNERNYLAELAYELKPYNSFHQEIVKKHLNTLIKKGFNF